jgi:hypothetical protein
MWLEKHRRLDWVKDQLSETVQQWNRSAEPWPADSISSYAGGPEPSSALGVPHDREGRLSAGTKRRITRRRRYLAITAAVMVVLAGYLATAGAAHVFPFPNNPPVHNPPVHNPPVQNLTQALVQLLPGDLGQHEHECHPMPPPHLWNMPGLVQELHCTDPGLKGGNVYVYQLDSATNFQTAWQNFNKWWKFLPGKAGKTCPPKHAAFGAISYSNSVLPPSDYQVQECGLLALLPNSAVPAYAWTFPTNNVFMIAEGGSGSSFSALASWLAHPATEPIHSTTATTPPVPQITSVGTYTQGVLVYFDIKYANPGNDADGFGFVGVKGSGWAEENHLFSSSSYGIVGKDSFAYPFNEECGTAQQSDSYIEAWINDTAGGRTKPVVIHLVCTGGGGPSPSGGGGPSPSSGSRPSPSSGSRSPSVPEITSVSTYTQGALVYFDIKYANPGNDAEGFGFVGVNGSGWAEENHPFTSPSYGIVGTDSIAYPFNEECGTAQQYDSYVQAWIYDTSGGRSTPVVIHLVCTS